MYLFLCERKSNCNSTKTSKYLIITRSITQAEHYWINVNFRPQSKMVAILIFLYTVACSVPVRDIPQVSPLEREFKVLDSGFQAMDSGFQVYDSTIFHSGFQSLLWDSGFFELFLDTKVQDPGFHKEKLADSGIPTPLHGATGFFFLK